MTEKWVKEVYEKILTKEEQVAKRNAHKIPYTTKDGVFDDKSGKEICWWTNGFWGGMMWQLYHATGNELYREIAIENEEKLDANLMNRQGMDHDSGFKWLPTAVAHYRLDGNGELMLTPMISGYGSIYADAAFSRESESVAYEAQTAGEGNDAYVPNEEGYYEEDGRGDYIPDDYVEESDPGDTYYWYDDAGDVIFFDGYENIYIGPGDVFYIDDAGRLAEY